MQYPRIRVVQTSVQSLKANYFGRYIAAEIAPESWAPDGLIDSLPAVLDWLPDTGERGNK